MCVSFIQNNCYISSLWKFSHKWRYSKPFTILNSIINCSLTQTGWLIVMVAKNWVIFLNISTWRMRKAWWDFIIKSDRFEAYWSIWINLSYFGWQSVIKGLEVYPFTHGRNQNERISDHISWKRFIDQFISNNIFISSKFGCYFNPEISKFLVKFVAWMVQVVECFTHIITKIILTPFCLVAIIPTW